MRLEEIRLAEFGRDLGSSPHPGACVAAEYCFRAPIRSLRNGKALVKSFRRNVQISSVRFQISEPFQFL
jgi:hypothetical protein